MRYSGQHLSSAIALATAVLAAIELAVVNLAVVEPAVAKQVAVGPRRQGLCLMSLQYLPA